MSTPLSGFLTDGEFDIDNDYDNDIDLTGWSTPRSGCSLSVTYGSGTEQALRGH